MEEALGIEPRRSAPTFRLTVADLLLFGVTVVALALLLPRVPIFRAVDWIYLLQHLIVLGIALTRRDPLVRDESMPSNLAVATAYLYPYAQVVCLSWWPGRTAWPEAGLLLVTLGAVGSVFCLLTIGKRFGVRPAWRGLETHGPYRLVRHPLYLTYLVADVGYNLQLWNPVTLLLLIVGWSAMIYRILAEERVLARDPKWPIYAGSVPSRLVPGLW